MASGTEAWCMLPSQPSRVIQISASGRVLSGIGRLVPMRYGGPKKIVPAARRLRGLPMRR
ncbi:hypothetical protein D3C72_2591170 [compost metagenome]